jgi:AraC family transcriptional regulator
MRQFAAGATDPESDSGQGLREGAETYERVLLGAGGGEFKALTNAAGRTSVYAALYASPAYALSVPSLRVPRLAVNLTAARVSGRIDGDRSRGFDARRHSLFLIPAGAPSVWRKESPSRHLGIYFHPNVFDGGDDDGSPLLQTPALLNANVPGVGQLADQLAGELQSPGILNIEAADSLARLLLIRLVRHLRRRSTESHALTPKTIARLRDYVLEHLSERVLVADLAKQAGLSANYFALCFTEFTGQSPHRFVLTLRLERAAQLLSRSESRLADIAHDCGFASQQHLSNAVRRHLGTTPSRYRALHKR